MSQEKGFTLIEIMIAVAILLAILSLGLIISLDFYKSYSFGSEKEVIVSMLQKARSQSLNNINQVRHGVHFENDSGLTYILFECEAATPQCNSYVATAGDIVVHSSFGISLTSPITPFDIIFDQLSGDCIISTTFDCSNENPIIINDENKTDDVRVNKEGAINW